SGHGPILSQSGASTLPGAAHLTACGAGSDLPDLVEVGTSLLAISRLLRHKPRSVRAAVAMRSSADSTATASLSWMYAAKCRLTVSRWIGSACLYFSAPASASAMC